MIRRFSLFLSLILLMVEVGAKAACEKTWLFFDLGENTLLYTGSHYPANDPHGDLVDMHYLPGVRAYLLDLIQKGYSVNLLVNIPEGWGVEGLEEYMNRPADPTTGDPGGWRLGATPFDWNFFGTIVVPLVNENRKPQHSDLPFASGELWLYREAMQHVPAGCDALLQTGIKEEIVAAEASGMFAWRHSDEGNQISLMPESQFQNFIDSHRAEMREAIAAQKEAEAEYAARGETIPRRTSDNPTE